VQTQNAMTRSTVAARTCIAIGIDYSVGMSRLLPRLSGDPNAVRALEGELCSDGGHGSITGSASERRYCGSRHEDHHEAKIQRYWYWRIDFLRMVTENIMNTASIQVYRYSL
jgi:hypothetical protein